MQNFSDTDAKKWQDHIHRRYRKWFGLAKSAEASILYRSHEHFGLKLKNLKEMKQQLQVPKWHIMKNSKDEESKEVYQYRLDLDRKGHIGQGRKTSPCLELEFVERSKALDLSAAGRHGGRQGLGFRPQAERKLTPREELIALMKKEAESKRLVVLH